MCLTVDSGSSEKVVSEQMHAIIGNLHWSEICGRQRQLHA